jgi:hypothetical protein
VTELGAFAGSDAIVEGALTALREFRPMFSNEDLRAAELFSPPEDTGDFIQFPLVT